MPFARDSRRALEDRARVYWFGTAFPHWHSQALCCAISSLMREVWHVARNSAAICWLHEYLSRACGHSEKVAYIVDSACSWLRMKYTGSCERMSGLWLSIITTPEQPKNTECPIVCPESALRCWCETRPTKFSWESGTKTLNAATG